MPKIQTLRQKSAPDQNDIRETQDAASRVSTRCVSAHLPEEMYWQLKELAALKRVEMQTLIAYAANALFRENGKPELPVLLIAEKRNGWLLLAVRNAIAMHPPDRAGVGAMRNPTVKS